MEVESADVSLEAEKEKPSPSAFLCALAESLCSSKFHHLQSGDFNASLQIAMKAVSKLSENENIDKKHKTSSLCCKT